MRRGVIVHNPASGTVDVYPELARVCDFLTARGWSIDLAQTRDVGDAGRLARQAAEAGLDAVLVAGGDGTLNEAANALVGTATAVGQLPCGTANVWARQLGVPTAHGTLLETARLLDAARVRDIDLGCVRLKPESASEVKRHFLLWSGVGLDAHVTRSVEPRPPSFRRWGVAGYSLAALRAALAFRGMEAHIEIDGRHTTERAVLIVVSNAELYAGYFHLALGARIDDGWLDVTILRGQGFLTSVGHFVRVLLGRHKRDPRAVTLRARQVRVTTTEACDVHVDAEPIGVSPAEYMVVPRALRVLVPPGAPDSLFSTRLGED